MALCNNFKKTNFFILSLLIHKKMVMSKVFNPMFKTNLRMTISFRFSKSVYVLMIIRKLIMQRMDDAI